MNRLTLTVPCRTNNGLSLDVLHEEVKLYFIERYGAYSAVAVSGDWVDADIGIRYPEDSVRYEVLVDEGIESLYPICKTVKIRGEQKCVLITCEEVHVECQ